ncbi:hypothetical protein HY212_05720 [Candidatus Pacearchaeota archaeon]|nr:hypothetical protein [Candidatus Pacearchaeota archaeon]
MQKAKFCPKCKSYDVKATTNIWNMIGGDLFWICNNCGFRAPMFPDEDDKIKKQRKLKKSKI